MAEPNDRPISNAALLRVMVLKEIRTTFRERSQMLGLVVAVVMLFVIVTASLLPALSAMRLRNAAAMQHAGLPATGPTAVPATTPAFAPTSAPTTASTAAPAPTTPTPSAAAGTPLKLTRQLRLISTGVVSGIGFFFSCGYLFAATLATFVGEKEARTLEILLASPLSDRKLYLVKCISVLLPSLVMALGFSIGVAALLLVLVPHTFVENSVQLIVVAVLLGAPLIALFQLWFVGIGAAISARTETMKGAGQVLGVVFLIMVFGMMYGPPLLITAMPRMIAPVTQAIRAVIHAAFPLQYLMILLALGLPAILFLYIGKWSFRRDRMLT